ncbi:MAG: VOC family protein [Bacteroidetes bacterium]|nr:VOC family protein [Bacteroidota bacterium]
MQNIIEKTNAVNWFEIPVTDTERAKKFYETILDIEMETQFVEETNEELTFFPFLPKIVRGTSGRVSGALVKNNRSKPSENGTMVYINANPSIQPIIDRIEAAGGKIILPKKKILAGCIAIFIDTEGNKVGLHAIE